VFAEVIQHTTLHFIRALALKQTSAFYFASKSVCLTFGHISHQILDALSANGKLSELSDATSKIFAAVAAFVSRLRCIRESQRSYETRRLRSHGGAEPIDVETRRYHLSTAFTLGGMEDGILKWKLADSGGEQSNKKEETEEE